MIMTTGQVFAGFEEFGEAVGSTIGATNSVVGAVGSVANAVGGVVNSAAGVAASIKQIEGVIKGLQGKSDSTFGLDGKFELPESDKFNTIGENVSVRQFILNVLNFFLTFLGLIATAVVIFAGYKYVTAMGDDGQLESSKKMILYAVVGILVILLSYALVNTVIKNAGTGGDDRENRIGELEHLSDQGGGYADEGNYGPKAGKGGYESYNGEFYKSDWTRVEVTDGTYDGTNWNKYDPKTAPNHLSPLPKKEDVYLVEQDGMYKYKGIYIIPKEIAKSGITVRLKYPAHGDIYFGDNTQGKISKKEEITHKYLYDGPYQIETILKPSEEVYWGGVQEVTVKTYVVVGDIIKAIITPLTSDIPVGKAAQLVGTQSTIASGAGQISSYDWVITDPAGEEWTGNGPSIVSPIFTDAGDYEVKLTVSNGRGSVSEATTTFKVVDPNGLDVEIEID